MELKLYSLAYPVTALGPGRRLAVWVAGCPLRCKGCITPHLLSSEAGKSIAVPRLAQRLLQLPLPLDGVTLTGGEPFTQAEALADLLSLVRVERPQWNVLTFSGFTLRQWQGGDAAQRQLLQQIDILVDGPYLAGKPGRHPLTASANQQLHLLTPRAQTLKPALDALSVNAANLGVNPQGEDCLIGIVDPATRRRLHRSLRLTTPDLEQSTESGNRHHVDLY
ncbi:MAG: 4Fe-4S single cluster domain-containing protein [Pseudomonadota bacterium]|nr:4Fe-4S single cluster domain-containing protein [Pseudomonadota bacterium]